MATEIGRRLSDEEVKEVLRLAEIIRKAAEALGLDRRAYHLVQTAYYPE